MDNIKLAQRTIAMLSSMIESGECHTVRSREMKDNALNGLEHHPTMKLRFIERAIPIPGEDNVGKVIRVLQQQYRGSLGSVRWADIPLVKE